MSDKFLLLACVVTTYFGYFVMEVARHLRRIANALENRL